MEWSISVSSSGSHTESIVFRVSDTIARNPCIGKPVDFVGRVLFSHSLFFFILTLVLRALSECIEEDCE